MNGRHDPDGAEEAGRPFIADVIVALLWNGLLATFCFAVAFLEAVVAGIGGGSSDHEPHRLVIALCALLGPMALPAYVGMARARRWGAILGLLTCAAQIGFASWLSTLYEGKSIYSIALPFDLTVAIGVMGYLGRRLFGFGPKPM